MTATIAVRYSCDCGLNDVVVDVPERKDDEAVTHWVGYTLGWAIKRDHARRRPWCMATKMRDVKIPTNNRAVIGGPIIQ